MVVLEQKQVAQFLFLQVLLWLNKTKSSHIFATHFHQLTTMNEITKLKKLAIKHMSVKNVNGGITLYKN